MRTLSAKPRRMTCPTCLRRSVTAWSIFFGSKGSLKAGGAGRIGGGGKSLGSSGRGNAGFALTDVRFFVFAFATRQRVARPGGFGEASAGGVRGGKARGPSRGPGGRSWGRPGRRA